MTLAHCSVISDFIFPVYILHSTSLPTGAALPGLPADLHAARIRPTMSPTPLPSFTLVKMVGPSPRINLESLSMTSREAPTYGAKSIWEMR